MTQLLFIEGVSGVGKSTLVGNLAKALRLMGKQVISFLEFDFNNPIDFYCTAYFKNAEYDRLCAQYKENVAEIAHYTIPAGEAMLVRYYNQDTPLFKGKLLADLKEAEFCYHPVRLVSLSQYSEAYSFVWTRFSRTLDETVDYYVFDGSLLHHPINDMLRNYGADKGSVGAHIAALLNTIRNVHWHVVYLYTDNIGEQLVRAHRDRGQNTPSNEEISFWEKRYDYDRYVLETQIGQFESYDVSDDGWEHILNRILSTLQ